MDHIPSGSLVRYRGMIQDMFDPEYFGGVYEGVDRKSGEKVFKVYFLKIFLRKCSTVNSEMSSMLM